MSWFEKPVLRNGIDHYITISVGTNTDLPIYRCEGKFSVTVLRNGNGHYVMAAVTVSNGKNGLLRKKKTILGTKILKTSKNLSRRLKK